MIYPFLLFIGGMFFILLAVFAGQLGLAHTANWGFSRFFLLDSGLALALTAALIVAWKTGRIPASLRRGLYRLAARVNRSMSYLSCRVVQPLVSNQIISIAISVLVISGIAVYAVWFTSNGTFASFVQGFNPYVDLGESFLHGQISLLEKPDPRIIALKDPYNDFAERSKIPYPFDISYYKGNYYLYWGPVPALVYAALESVARVRPANQAGMLFFFIGLSILQLILLFQVRRRWFPSAPALTIPFFLLAAFLNLPFFFLLARSNVHETAVVAGQFFLFLSLLAWVVYQGGKKIAWLFLAGLSAGLAVGSRYNLAISVGVFLLFELVDIWKEDGWNRLSAKRAAVLLSPLILTGLVLACYNYARFENPLQTGLVYQLVKPWHQKLYYSPGYVLTSLYMYLFYPPTTQGSFPFLLSIPVDAAKLPAWAAMLPTKDQEEVIFGALRVIPILWMIPALAAVLGVGSFWFKRAANRPALTQASVALVHISMRRQFTSMIFIAGLLQMFFLLFYYYSAMRFMGDFYPLLLVSLLLAAWELDELARSSGSFALRLLTTALWLAAGLLTLGTVLFGLLGAFDIPPQLFRLFNLAAFRAIAARLNPIYLSYAHLRDGSSIIGTLIRLVIRFTNY